MIKLHGESVVIFCGTIYVIFGAGTLVLRTDLSNCACFPARRGRGSEIIGVDDKVASLDTGTSLRSFEGSQNSGYTHLSLPVECGSNHTLRPLLRNQYRGLRWRPFAQRNTVSLLRQHQQTSNHPPPVDSRTKTPPKTALHPYKYTLSYSRYLGSFLDSGRVCSSEGARIIQLWVPWSPISLIPRINPLRRVLNSSNIGTPRKSSSFSPHEFNHAQACFQYRTKIYLH